MIPATNPPDALTLLRTAAAAVVFLYLPGRVFFHDGLGQLIESVFFSVILLCVVGMALAFTVGIHEWTLLTLYAILGLIWWVTKKS